ncbi:MAG: hypothetical protein OES09_04680 [Gammaproteobacteria bacterium]|nr:hypothetical protein [Gammaproteobacteria bacterium]
MSNGRLQMTVFAMLVAMISVGVLAYIVIVQPAYLRETRNGVPYFTPPVIHPETGEPVDLERLVEHYRGED